ncbi:uncharacterized protein ANIA_10817 [Aspergillus nidulans FGSC A4]|uniref:Uncharacterized protein n=1 Tax=Emericella nidulans (strain FGSC A4 / ATCC 38163 / CBS 112.46 / NRRL 194 / M139) TaxID=227321 RepID=C8V0E3_EMENI|nr:hypothetical protein [Aspergillus nidulans FGSC A4]CBF69465.1 TPA: hypothetical protein ANIA_10817 [Aspergillus nidulans FGSC A4]
MVRMSLGYPIDDDCPIRQASTWQEGWRYCWEAGACACDRSPYRLQPHSFRASSSLPATNHCLVHLFDATAEDGPANAIVTYHCKGRWGLLGMPSRTIGPEATDCRIEP